MSDKVINTVTKVPLLGDIPILGFFFRSSTKKVVKTNLIIALTPYVIKDMSDLRRVLEKKMKERREFVERYGGAGPPDRGRTFATAGSAACSRRSTGRARDRRWSRTELDDAPPAAAAGRVGSASSCRSDRAAASAAAARRRAGGGRRRPRRRPEETSTVAKKRLGELLLELKAKTPGSMPTLTPESIEQALATQKEEGGRLGEILLKMRAITEEDCCRRSGCSSGSPTARISRPTTSTSIWRRRSRSTSPSSTGCWWSSARATPRWWRSPIRSRSARSTTCACSCSWRCSRSWCRRSGSSRSSTTSTAAGRTRAATSAKDEDEEDDEGGSEELVDILDPTDEAPIIRWVNSLMFQAVKERASDIHIEPGEKDVIVRYRIDGVLHETRRAARQFMPSIISRVKIMAGLNIAEKRLPQDGRIRRKIAGKDIDMRVATAPTVSGERITIRLLDRESVLLDLADIGFGDDHLRRSTSSSTGRTASCWSPARPAPARRRRCTRASPRSTRPTSTSSPSRIPVEYQLEGISQTRSTRRST